MESFIKETVEFERKKKQLEKALADFKEQQKIFEREKRDFERKMEAQEREFTHKMEAKERAMEQQGRLFDMKWKLLEEQTAKVAEERKQVEKQKEFYNHLCEFENRTYGSIGGDCRIMFTGVDSEQGLKRRYRDLLKIFHPDNPEGDNNLVQEISREYDELKQSYGRG